MNKKSLEVWMVDLRTYWDKEKDLIKFLDAGEKNRSSGFKFHHLRRNYVVSHALLRLLIARYLDIDATHLSLCYERFGKPFIQNTPLHFNMSHSNHMALYVFSQIGEVGIDIEYMDPNLSMDCLPIAALPPHMQKEISLYPSDIQPVMFYRKWVQIEAYLKAIGLGLSIPLSTLHIPNSYTLQEVLIPKGYIGAVASEATSGSPISIIHRTIDIEID